MRSYLFTTIIFTAILSLTACNKTEDKTSQEHPVMDAVMHKAELQKAKDLEQKMLQDAEDQRKVIELQTNAK